MVKEAEKQAASYLSLWNGGSESDLVETHKFIRAVQGKGKVGRLVRSQLEKCIAYALKRNREPKYTYCISLHVYMYTGHKLFFEVHVEWDGQYPLDTNAGNVELAMGNGDGDGWEGG